jgi:hypothetical protein
VASLVVPVKGDEGVGEAVVGGDDLEGVGRGFCGGDCPVGGDPGRVGLAFGGEAERDGLVEACEECQMPLAVLTSCSTCRRFDLGQDLGQEIEVGCEGGGAGEADLSCKDFVAGWGDGLA